MRIRPIEKLNKIVYCDRRFSGYDKLYRDMFSGCVTNYTAIEGFQDLTNFKTIYNQKQELIKKKVVELREN